MEQKQEEKKKYRYVRLGASGLKVSEVSLGAMTFSFVSKNFSL